MKSADTQVKEDKSIVVLVIDRQGKKRRGTARRSFYEVDTRCWGMNKARIERALRLEGIENVRFFNPTVPWATDPMMRISQKNRIAGPSEELDNGSTLYAGRYSSRKQANEKCFDKIQMVQDDKQLWGLDPGNRRTNRDTAFIRTRRT